MIPAPDEGSKPAMLKTVIYRASPGHFIIINFIFFNLAGRATSPHRG